MTTADERVERVGCMVRRSEMEEGLVSPSNRLFSVAMISK